MLCILFVVQLYIRKNQKRNGTALFVKNDIDIEGFQEHCGRGWSVTPF